MYYTLRLSTFLQGIYINDRKDVMASGPLSMIDVSLIGSSRAEAMQTLIMKADAAKNRHLRKQIEKMTASIENIAVI